MKSILEYIMLNYTWFLVGAIIILLAIIGRYADKTNFGQGNDNEKEKIDDEKLKLDNIQKINDALNNNQKIEEIKKETEVVKETVVKEPETIIEERQLKLEESFEKFDKEFDELLPEREIIDDELLEEIDSLSLEKTQKIKLTDIPDLDDVELPKIKSMSIDEDIWKF